MESKSNSCMTTKSNDEPIKLNVILFILGLAAFIVMADNWVVSPILPAISKDLGVSVTSAGILISAYMIPFGLFQLIFGPLSDRFGKRQILNFTMFFSIFGVALTAFGKSLGQLTIYRAITGIFAASVMPVSMALIGDLVPMEKRQSAIATFMGAAFLGQSLSMFIGGSIAYFLNWRSTFIVYAVLAAFVTIIYSTVGHRIPSQKNPKSEFLVPYGRLLKNTSSLIVYILILLEGMFILGSFSYLGAFIDKIYRFNYLTIGFIMTAFGFTALIGGRVSIKLSSKLGKRNVIILGLVLAAFADMVFFIAGNVLWSLVIGIALLGLGLTLEHSTLITIATGFAVKARGCAMSLVAFCFMGGGGIGTAVGGKLIKISGFKNYYMYYGILLIILAFLAGSLLKYTIKNE
ncbi:MFS transporter [Clostridium sp. 001]|uniref:MFS transporter n=1 Tax=Clostridium sp. 001 TaxID=1970093 RepID=UPI0020B73E44|nr:MFS transporter [Clostridium sp. 001]